MDVSGIVSGLFDALIALFNGLVDIVVSVTGVDDRAVGVVVLLVLASGILWLVGMVLRIVRFILGLVVAVGIVWMAAHFLFGVG